MGSIKSFLDWVKGGDAEDDYDEEMSRQPRSEEPAINSVPSSYENRSYDHSYSSATVENTVSQPRHESLRDNKVVSINTTSKLAVVLVKPDRFGQAHGGPQSGADKQGYRASSGGFSERCCICE